MAPIRSAYAPSPITLAITRRGDKTSTKMQKITINAYHEPVPLSRRILHAFLNSQYCPILKEIVTQVRTVTLVNS